MITDEQRAEVRRLLAHGRSKREIARTVGVSDGSVRNIAREPETAKAAEKGARKQVEAARSRLEGRTAGRAGTLAARLEARATAAELQAIAPEADEEPDEAPSLESLLRTLGGLTRRLDRVATAAEKSGNLTAAQRSLRDLGQVMPVIVRLEKLIRDNRDAIHVTAEDLEAARARVADRIVAIRSRGPMRCAACSRELSIDLAGARAKIAESDAARRLRDRGE